MLSRDYRDVPKEPVGEDKSIRWLIGEPEGAPNFAMRVVEFEPGAVFETHHHPYEHEIFVLEGQGVAHTRDGEEEMRPGIALYVPPSEPHGYRNTGDGPLRFICVIPYPEE
ncbi:MAG: cupin domain-containing protein [Anaerolineae bacterium]|jgi:quercetin dioxygenase-like cupin family protein